MPLLKLIAEGVGPFEHVEIDFSDGNGKPHLGPHILAGVNGSGKSTILRAIAWVVGDGGNGFDVAEWKHSMEGRAVSRAALQFDSWVTATGAQAADLDFWVLEKLGVRPRYSREPGKTSVLEGEPKSVLTGAYAPVRSLRYISRPSLTKDPENTALSFETTVDNEAIQAWILGLHSQAAIAEKRKESSQRFTATITRFTNALELIYGEQVKLLVEYDPELHPRLIVAGKSLNFSQLPQGISNTVGWLADFMMRQSKAKAERGLLLIDEIDAHLHPAWQRLILPAIRKALPGVQIIVTTHSPFVISSCPDAKVHLLEVDMNGSARLARSVDAPFGESIFATMKDIFGVKSRFDPQTERELDEWVELQEQSTDGNISERKKSKLASLTQTLAGRSEELRAIVSPGLKMPAKRTNGRKAKRKTS